MDTESVLFNQEEQTLSWLNTAAQGWVAEYLIIPLK